MLFNSYIFLFVFLPVVLLGFAVFSRLGPLAVKIWLTLASFFFYAWWNPQLLTLLLLSIGFNYFMGRSLLAAARRGSIGNKAALIVGVTVNLGVLAYFKYANFIIDNVTALTGVEFAIGAVMLPLAISFFTFQQIAYLFDAAKGEADDYGIVDYALFVSFFPQLIAGPIVHHREMMPQFQRDQFNLRIGSVAVGMAFLIMGLAKKVLIADNIDVVSDRVFDSAIESPSGMIAAWVALTAFSLGIYFDFSGYTDMAIGLARIFGVRLPFNFNSPYKAISIVDFWRRWHMTLSRFLRDYLYIPLGGNRKGRSRRYANLMIVMLLGGLWHGAAWTFVIWGGLHGLYLMVNHAWQAARQRGWVFELGPAAARILTLAAVMVAWTFFRAGSFDEATAMLLSLFGANGITAGTADLSGPRLAIMVLAAVIALAAPNSQEIIDGWSRNQSRRRIPDILRWHPNVAWAGALSAMFFVALPFMAKTREFVYFNF